MEKGSITAGRQADVVMPSRYYKSDPKEIENVRVMLTIVDGLRVHQAG